MPINGRGLSSAERPSEVEPLLVKPRVAWRMLGCGNTKGYELLKSGELQSFHDGRSRKIVVKSIHDFIARGLAVARRRAPKRELRPGEDAPK